MSIVVVEKKKDEIIIASDTQQTIGEYITISNSGVKIREVRGIVIGSAGYVHIASLLESFIEKSDPEEVKNLNNTSDFIHFFSSFKKYIEDIYGEEDESKVKPVLYNEFIIIINDRVWLFNGFEVREIKENQFHAIGSGTQAAYTAKYFTDDIEHIIKAVCKVDLYCSEPIEVKKIKINK